MSDRRDDLEASLADIDRKLRDLQAELQVVRGRDEASAQPARPPRAEPPPPPAAPPPPPRHPEPAALERVAELLRRIEELRRLSAELEDATRALQEELSHPPAATTWSGQVVVRAGPFRDIESLGQFERALAGIPGAEDAFVRSFAGDRALLELCLRREIDLVGEMRRALSTDVRVLDSGPDELEIALGP